MSGAGPLDRRHRRARRRGQEGRLPEEPAADRSRQRRCARSTSRARRSSPPTRSAASSARWTRSAARPPAACRPSCACRWSSRSSRQPAHLGQRPRAGAAALDRRLIEAEPRRHPHAAERRDEPRRWARSSCCSAARRDHACRASAGSPTSTGRWPATSSSACSRQLSIIWADMTELELASARSTCTWRRRSWRR